MALHVFGRFHAKPGCEGGVERALRDTVHDSTNDPGCLSIRAFKSVRDDRLYYIHSTWQDLASFEFHADLAHTVAFIKEIEALIDHPVQAVRTQPLD